LFKRNSVARVFAKFFSTPVEFGLLFRRKFIVEIPELQVNGFNEFAAFRFGHPAQFFENFCPAHGGDLLL
jgi:hypothetical protein